MVSKTPENLVIQPREIAFGRETTHPRWWMGGDPVATAFFNALSVTFPAGERYFMDSVRRYKDRAPPELRAQIAAFLKQEALHSREHVAFNTQVTDSGYEISHMEERLKERLNISRKAPPAVQLASTCALEHFTAILAHALLARPEPLNRAPIEAARMWRWHAMEEIEHKAVAFDTYVAGVRRGGAVGRWMLRCFVMAVTTVTFTMTISRNISELFHQDGLSQPRAWASLMRFLWLKPGLMRGVVKPYLAYYRPGFHPWDEDDRDLVVAVQAEMAPA